MDYRAAGFWFAVGQGIFNVIVVIWMAISRKHQANNKRVQDLEKSNATKITQEKAQELIDRQIAGCEHHQEQTAQISDKVTRLEEEVRNLPSRKEIQGLNTNITNLTEKLGRVEGRLEGINRVADLMNQHLISQGNKP